jgi:hypothetical protein
MISEAAFVSFRHRFDQDPGQQRLGQYITDAGRVEGILQEWRIRASKGGEQA